MVMVISKKLGFLVKGKRNGGEGHSKSQNGSNPSDLKKGSNINQGNSPI
jgi:hypothetical protein